MSKFGSLGTAEIVEDCCFSYQGLILGMRHREQYVLTWVLLRCYWTYFSAKEGTHHLFKPSTVDIILLHHLLSTLTLIKAFGP